RLRRLAPALAAGGVLGPVPVPPRAGTRARLRLAVARRPPAAGAVPAGPVALVAARTETRRAHGAVRGTRLAAGHVRPVRAAEPPLLRGRRVPAGARAGACTLRRVLRQPAGGHGHARDPWAFRPQDLDVGH